MSFVFRIGRCLQTSHWGKVPINIRLLERKAACKNIRGGSFVLVTEFLGHALSYIMSKLSS